MTSSIVHASGWDKDISGLATSLTLEQSSNITNNTVDPVASSVHTLAIVNNSVSLFEGYGISLPFSVQHQSYSANDDFDNTAYQLNPALQVFWSQDTTLTFSSNINQTQLFSGSVGAEFVESSLEPLRQKQRQAAVSLQIGQAPNQQFFTLNAAYSDRETQQSELSSTKKSKDISANYGYRISEDSYLQFNGSYAWQLANGQTTRIAQAGLGFITGLGGSNQLNVIVGGYNRLDQQQTGIYWTISDHWAISQQATFKFTTSQRSVLSNDFKNTSQLTTTYTADTEYQLSETHQLTLVLSQQRSKISSSGARFNKRHLSLDWQWIVSSGITLNSFMAYANYSRFNSVFSSDSTQRKFGLNARYQW